MNIISSRFKSSVHFIFRMTNCIVSIPVIPQDVKSETTLMSLITLTTGEKSQFPGEWPKRVVFLKISGTPEANF